MAAKPATAPTDAGSTWTRRLLLWPLQAAGLWLFWLTALLPIEYASNIGARFFGVVGSRQPSSRKMAKNLRHAFPARSAAEISGLVRGAWENLGRSVAELPHLAHLARGPTEGWFARVEVVGEEHIAGFRDSGQPIVFVSGHLGNWDIAGPTLVRLGVPLTVVYAPMENPIIDRMLYWRRMMFRCELVPKDLVGTRRLIKSLRNGQSLGLLVDRKRKDGALIPFFGRDAWTTTAPARLALKFGCPLIPMRIERLEGSRFRATIYPPLETPLEDEEDRVMELTRQMNAAIEGWVRERPDQWWCNTKRWPNKSAKPR